MSLCRIASIVTVLAAFSSVPSVAQSYDQGEQNNGQRRYQSEGSGSADRYQDDDRQSRRAEDGDRDWNASEQSRRRWSERMRMMRSPAAPTSDAKGARFRIEMGDASVDVRCPPANELQSCVEAAGRLIDKMVSQQSGAQKPSVEKGTGTETIPRVPGEMRP
jgi:hypothetical protein